MPTIRTEKLTKIYKQGAVEVIALNEVDLQISKGDFAVVAEAGDRSAVPRVSRLAG